MDFALPKPVQLSDLMGHTLYGNDFDDEALAAWMADEDRGFYDLHESKDPGGKVADDHQAMNDAHGAFLRDREYPTVLLLGCADGSDFKSLGIAAGCIIAIEPAREWWSDALAGVPADFRAPTLTGAIDLSDGSVDLVVALGVLHHIANVERVVAELARVLKPGGRMMIREPMVSMGDFRRPRRGLTAHERGIPRQLMRAFHRHAGMRVMVEKPCSSQVVRLGLRKLGVDAYTRSWGVRVDDAVSRLTAPFTPYWRRRPWEKLGPASLLVVSEKA